MDITREEQKEQMRAARLYINDLIGRYCRRCPYGTKPLNKTCEACFVYADMRGAAEVLDGPWLGREAERILQKGADMSREEMRFLILEGVEKVKIREACGYSATMFGKLLQDLELTERHLAAQGFPISRHGGFNTYWEQTE